MAFHFNRFFPCSWFDNEPFGVGWNQLCSNKWCDECCVDCGLVIVVVCSTISQSKQTGLLFIPVHLTASTHSLTHTTDSMNKNWMDFGLKITFFSVKRKLLETMEYNLAKKKPINSNRNSFRFWFFAQLPDNRTLQHSPHKRVIRLVSVVWIKIDKK